ncbi:MAG: PAS domain S-box protein, partial [Actinomycetota bacterium]
IFHRVVEVADPASPQGWIAALAAALVASLVGVVMVISAISLSEGKPQLNLIPQMLVAGMIVTITNASLGLVAAMIMWTTPGAAWALLIPSATLVIAYRAYTSMRDKHEGLEFLYESIRTIHKSPNLETATVSLLAHAREAFRADIAEIILFASTPDESDLRTTLGPADRIELMTPIASKAAEVVRDAAGHERAALMPAKERTATVGDYLASRDITDAMIAPLNGETGVMGAIIVGERLGDVSTFDNEDLKLFEALASHGSAMLQVQRLEKSLAQLTELQEELRIRAEALHESEERFKGAFRYAVTGMAVSNIDGRMIEVNEALCRMLGYSEEELLATDVQSITHPDDRAGTQEVMARLVGGETNYLHFSKRYLRRDQRTVWADIGVSLVRDATGSPHYFVSQIQDITETKAAEEARARLTAILENTSDFVGMADLDGHTLYVNKAARRLLGMADDEALSGHGVGFNHPDWAQKVLVDEAIPTAMRDGVWSGELAMMNAEGREVPVSQVVVAHKAPTGGVEFVSTIARDITEQKRLEEQLRQSQKMDAVGRLAGGVAHDFNNLLAVILNYASFLAEDFTDSDPRKQDLDEIHRAGQRAADLTRQLLTFSRREVIDPRVLNLNDVVSEIQRLLSRVITENIDFEVDVCPQALHTKIDPGQIEQVLMNLVINARDAMPEGGRLIVRTSAEVVDEFASDGPVLPQGNYVCLTVADTGRGMTPDVKAHIFEPFFTTKPTGQGTGLGLATVYGIVRQAGGDISVFSDPGVGSTFKAYLPVSEDQISVASEGNDVTADPGRGETILVAEDEVSVGNLVRRILERSEYTVLVARSPKEALEISSSYKEEIDLLLTDVIMPQMSGKDLAEKITETRPGIKTVYMSGYTDQVIGDLDLLGDDEAFIEKPFTAEGLLRCVSTALGRPRYEDWSSGGPTSTLADGVLSPAGIGTNTPERSHTS